MTTIATQRAVLRQPTSAPAQEQPKRDTSPDVTKRKAIAGSAGIALGLGAVAGALYLRRPIASKVIGAVDGVALLSNPRTPRGVGAITWETPKTGSLFGAAPGPKVSIEHVDQGALGDCWNIAGMGAIAQRTPEVFEKIVQESGDHVIVHLANRSVAVTKELPIGSKGGPRFGGSGPEDPVYWPAYVEKAQAAIERNGYRSLEGGVANTTFEQLLGTTAVPMRSRGTILDDVRANYDAGRPLAIGTRDHDTQLMKELKVHGNHYYVVTGVEGTGANARVTLFNPWGVEHPNRPLAPDELDSIFTIMDSPTEFIAY